MRGHIPLSILILAFCVSCDDGKNGLLYRHDPTPITNTTQPNITPSTSGSTTTVEATAAGDGTLLGDWRLDLDYTTGQPDQSLNITITGSPGDYHCSEFSYVYTDGGTAHFYKTQWGCIGTGDSSWTRITGDILDVPGNDLGDFTATKLRDAAAIPAGDG